MPLTLVAGPESVRLFHGAEAVACHTRSYDAGFIAEDPAHLRAGGATASSSAWPTAGSNATVTRPARKYLTIRILSL